MVRVNNPCKVNTLDMSQACAKHAPRTHQVPIKQPPSTHQSPANLQLNTYQASNQYLPSFCKIMAKHTPNASQATAKLLPSSCCKELQSTQGKGFCSEAATTARVVHLAGRGAASLLVYCAHAWCTRRLLVHVQNWCGGNK